MTHNEKIEEGKVERDGDGGKDSRERSYSRAQKAGKGRGKKKRKMLVGVRWKSGIILYKSIRGFDLPSRRLGEVALSFYLRKERGGKKGRWERKGGS